MSYKTFLANKIRDEGPLLELYAAHQVIDAIPPEFWEQPVERLHLEEVAFEGTFPEQIFAIRTLKDLRLCCVADQTNLLDSENYIRKTPSAAKLSRLEELDLSGNSLEDLPDGLDQLNELKYLDLSENRLSKASSWLIPGSVTKLDLSGNHLSTVPSHLKNLKNLEELALAKNDLLKIEELPSSLAKLDLSLNPLVECPNTFKSLGNLRELRLWHCGLEQITGLSGHLKLEKVDLSANHLTEMDEGMTNCKHLGSLNLSKNKIQKLPDSISELAQLIILNVEENSLNQLPGSIKRLTSLKAIRISRNKFESFPKELCSLQNLESIHANWNNFGQILPGIGNLKKLKHIHLHKAGLLFLPEDFKELTLLEQCELSYNPIKQLPDFSKMINLRFLGLSGLKDLESPMDQISKISNLPNLGLLSLTNTPLRTLPLSLKENPNLKRIDIGNPLWSEEEKMILKELFHPIYLWFNK